MIIKLTQDQICYISYLVGFAPGSHKYNQPISDAIYGYIMNRDKVPNPFDNHHCRYSRIIKLKLTQEQINYLRCSLGHIYFHNKISGHIWEIIEKYARDDMTKHTYFRHYDVSEKGK